MSDVIVDGYDPAVAEEQGRRAHALYESRLKAMLEPEENGKVVAIHVESGDYEVGARRDRPHFLLKRRQPAGTIYIMGIGPQTPDDGITWRVTPERLFSGEYK